MRVRDVMTTPVLAVEPTQSVADAAKLMLDNRVSGLVVVTKDNRLVGIVTEGDFLRRSELGTQAKRPRWLEFLQSNDKLAKEYIHASSRTVSDVMTANVVTASADSELEDLVALMIARKVKRVPIVANGKLVGIVARSDLMRAMLRASAATGSAAAGDDAICQTIVRELNKQPWSQNSAIRVRVHEGVAELEGTVFSDTSRKAARIVAENTPGVTKVIDHLAWIEPMSGTLIVWPDDHDQTGG